MRDTQDKSRRLDAVLSTQLAVDSVEREVVSPRAAAKAESPYARAVRDAAGKLRSPAQPPLAMMPMNKERRPDGASHH